MTKRIIEQEEFYPELIELMGTARKSIALYTISCCFGFYSHGLKNFENVYLAIRDCLSKIISRHYLDVKVLVKVDYDNPIDIFAAERLAQLESRYSHTGKVDSERNVFRELGAEATTVQFLVVDDGTMLISEIQEEFYNEELDLVLNKSQKGIIIAEDDDVKTFANYQKLFSKTWNASSFLDVEVSHVSRRKLKFILEKYEGARYINSERELQLILAGYLQGNFDQSIVDLELPLGGTRIDLVVGPRPHNKRHGIELKYHPTNKNVDEIVGQIRNYRKEYEHVVLIVYQPKYTAQRRRDLSNELKQIDVALIEWK